jgi:hypothetical protein
MNKMNYYSILYFLIFLIINKFKLIYVFELNNYQNALYQNANINDEDDEIFAWKKEDYPSPFEKPQYCKRPEPSLVCDPDRIVNRKQGK